MTHRLTVGILTPHAAAGPEVELPAMTRGRLHPVLSRAGSPPEEGALGLASTAPAAVESAAAAWRGSRLDAVGHASTTTGYVIGRREEATLRQRLSDRFEVPAVTGGAAVAAALAAHKMERVQLVHPPWFDESFDELGVAYFGSYGLDGVVTRATGLPGDPARVESRHVVDWCEHHLDERAEAVFLAGNGFRAAAAVEELELCTGRLVLQANQALLWGILAATRTSWNVTGYGHLLRASTSTTST